MWITQGAAGLAPLLIGVVPFGLVFGVTAAASVLGGGLGYATSIIIFAGAAQFVTIELFDQGAAAVVVIATALVVNSRHLMYSAALAPHFQQFPTRSRYTLPYLMTDQAFAVSFARYGDLPNPSAKRWYYLGAAGTLWISWQISTLAGVLLGAQIPQAWSLAFAIPLVFLALLMPTVVNRPTLTAAIVGGGVAVLAANVPYGLGLMIGALAGVVAGVIAERFLA